MAKRYIIYTLSSCGFCSAAKDLLRDKRVEFYEFNLDEDPEFLLQVKKFYDHNTVPVVVENDIESGETNFVGGFSELNGVLDVNRMCTITYK
jgi:glutaredoxin